MEEQNQTVEENLTQTETASAQPDSTPKEQKESKKAKDSKNAKELEEAKAERDAINDKYLRMMAEYDNYRKRAVKDRENTYADAYGDVLKEILPIADNLERALATETADENYAQGVKMIYQQLKESFARLGIEEIVCESFDPNYHNAVMHIEDEAYGEGAIVEVFQKGYKKGDRVLRFAMVKVAN